MARVSVIIPVYNTEKYLSKCIDSVIKQSLSDIEILCVDDGSTDGSSEILDKYAKKDTRIKVIHQENGGYGKAVNAGIDNASGEYVGIVESDDSVLSNMYESLYDAAKKNDLDLVKGECYFCWDSLNYRIPFHKPSNYYEQVLLDKDRNNFFTYLTYNWSGIYKKSFLDQYNIRHNETPGASYQDNGFWIQTMCLAQRAMWIPKPFYLYRQDNENSSIHSREKMFAMMDEFEWAAGQLRRHNISDDLLRRVFQFGLFRHRGTMLRIADELKEEFAEAVVKNYEKYGHFLTEEEFPTMFSWHQELIKSPHDYCVRLIENKKRISKSLDDANDIWIYGEGAYGQRALRVLFNYGWIDKVRGFVISEVVERSSLGLFPIRNINDPDVDFSKSQVILGIKKDSLAHDEMKNNLMNICSNPFIEAEELLDVFYLVY